MNKEKNREESRGGQGATLSCGIIMPISPIDGCAAEHWSEVKQIIQDAVDAINEPKFTAKLVSDADDIGVIQKRIVQGVYSSDIVVCDVSAKNSNVMFELGMRLAFDKPTVIIKDDKTEYSFDTSIIEHISYPRDLRFSKIVGFKKSLAEKIVATYMAARDNPNHSTFLKNFGTFKVAHLNQTEAPGEQVMLEMLADMQRELSLIRRQSTRSLKNSLSEVQITPIVEALFDLKKMEPNLLLEPNSTLIDRLLSLRPDLARYYPTKKSFEDALFQACDAVRAIA